MKYSIVSPVYNEAGNIERLVAEILGVMSGLGEPFEVILVDDGSTDGTATVLKTLSEANTAVKVVSLRRNFGQTAALMAGFDQAAGEVIISIDADGQNDPGDIPILLEELRKGHDVVSGWRRKRREPNPFRVFLSAAANRLISWVSRVPLRDYGCTLKAYRREILEDVHLYGEMHRFIPIYAHWQGARITECAVNHRPREYGKSKYGLNRTVKVVLDLLVIVFMDRYAAKPIYVFGSVGLLSLVAAFSSAAYSLYLKYAEGISLIETPMPLLAALLFLTGVLSALMGLLAELTMRTYFESQKKRPYAILSKRNFE